MNTDPIADFLTRIRNASRAGDTNVSIPFSRLKEEMGKILEQEGFIEKSRIDRTGKFP
jgi:small subunit ribosomal protein S8